MIDWLWSGLLKLNQLHSGKLSSQFAKSAIFTTVHSGFFLQFLFRLETSSAHFMSRITDITKEPIDDFTSKLINYGKESIEKDQF